MPPMIPLTRHGFRELLIGSVALLIVAIGLGYAWAPLALLVVPFFLFLFAFFRDPERPVPMEQHVMVSPADGVVSDITEVADDALLGEPGIRIGIFLSVFNVHVNRAPCDGRVAKVEYKKGKFINAMNHNVASSDNESNTVLLVEPTGDRPVAVVKQIVGLIARRIIFPLSEGETVRRGDRIGMIKFGSRTELTIPLRLKPTVRVSVGQKVRGAADILAVLGEGVHTTVAQTSPEAVSEEAEPLVGRRTPA